MQFLMVRIIIPEKAKFNVFFFYKKGYIIILCAFKFNFGSCESLLETTACGKRETWAKPLKHNIGGEACDPKLNVFSDWLIQSKNYYN